MSAMSKYENLSTRSGFNSVVRHVKTTISLVESLAGKMNLADILSDKSLGADLSGEQLAAILRMTLVDKLGYKAVSRNLRSAAEDLGLIAAEVSKWNSVDVVLAYHHPDVGLVVANPKNAEQLALFGALRKREVAVAYVGRFEKAADESCAAAGEALLELLEGTKVSVPASLYKGDFAFKAPKKKVEPAEKKAPKEKASAKGKASRAAKKAAAEVPAAPIPAAVAPRAAAAPVAPPPASGPRPGSRMTPMYSVVVQNELFHNGNVEAWKRIIDSYKTKYPALEVYIYYDGERILNINSLFKWGKVKHGSTIQFAVAGTEIKDVAKLQRYLIQGASHQFEAFLHGPVSTVLKLF